jgi:enoyl-CoA hydratase
VALTYTYIKLEIEGGVAVITLDRPGALNALNRDLVDELDGAVDALGKNEEVKAVIITGGKNFAAGADITNMMTLTPEQAKGFSFVDTFAKLEGLPQPTIAVMSGYALGGGLELALSCDFRVAGPDAKFGFPEINLGIFPGAGGTQRLPKLIGTMRAKEMILTGKTIDATSALEYGLINSVADDPMEEGKQLAQKLAGKAAVALGLAKRCINLAENVDARSGFDFEKIAWASTFATEDQKEGMKAFVEKRKPNFIGR